MNKITCSVGYRASNRKVDTAIVQRLLNKHHRPNKTVQLKPDGIAGTKTIARIKEFQKTIVKMAHPDGRVDPRGRTFHYLGNEAIKADTTFKKADTTTPQNNIAVSGLPPACLIRPTIVSYKAGKRKDVVSSKTEEIIHLALVLSGMPHAVITQTIRTLEEQTNIMYEFGKEKAAGTNTFNYKKAGTAVANLYDAKKDPAEIKKLMSEQIKKNPYAVSRHLATLEQYKKRNVIDIGRGSTYKACGAKNYNRNAFTKALEELKALGYIDKYIPEGSCWHVEIKQ